MKKLSLEQRGMTFLGLVFVLGFIAIVVLFVMRAFPIFYERTQVIAALESAASREGSKNFTEREARDAFLRAISITNIERFDENNVKDYVLLEKSTEKGGPKILRVKYQATNKLAGGLQLLLEVDESRPMETAGTGG